MPVISPLNAKEMAAKSVEARRKRSFVPAMPDFPPVQPVDEYVQGRLACVRAQLGRIDALLLQETDPQKLDRLASAQARLSEQERILANRPLPGSLKPSSKPSRGQSYPTLDPKPIEPVPQSQSQPQVKPQG